MSIVGLAQDADNMIYDDETPMRNSESRTNCNAPRDVNAVRGCHAYCKAEREGVTLVSPIIPPDFVYKEEFTKGRVNSRHPGENMECWNQSVFTQIQPKANSKIRPALVINHSNSHYCPFNAGSTQYCPKRHPLAPVPIAD